MNSPESVVFDGITASTATFPLRGGVYSFRAVNAAWNSKTLALQAVLPDGSSLATVNNFHGTAALLSANGSIDGIYLAPGQYQLTASGTPTDPWDAVVASVPDALA
jgi:hypothetical protein